MTRAGYTETSPQKALRWAHRKAESLARRPATVSAGGVAIYAIEVFEPDHIIIAGDDAFDWPIPEDLDGATLLKVEGAVTHANTSGSMQVQLAKRNGSGTVLGDLLTTKITVEANELNSKDAAAQPVVDSGSISDFVWGDHIRVDVDAAGSGGLGLHVICYFVPLATKTLAVQGAKGDPGGVTSWQGQWTTATAYTAGQAVSNNGSSYVARVDHTSGASSEPGVGASWETNWMLLAEAQKDAAVQVSINGNGFVLDTGVKGYAVIPWACTLKSVTMLADTVGSIVVDVWKDTYANHPPTDADSITSSSPPTISSANKSTDTALAGWSTSLAQGDILAFNIDSCTFITKLALSLKVEKI